MPSSSVHWLAPSGPSSSAGECATGTNSPSGTNPTAQINDTLQELVARRQAPQAAGREVKFIYATQVETAPPAIAVFGNNPDAVQEHYVRYLHNGFREKYGFIGNPLRILLRRKNG